MSLRPKEGGRERYVMKLGLVDEHDPHEIPKREWIDDLESWPAVTYIHVGMCLLFRASSYTQDQLMNYKSLKCASRRECSLYFFQTCA